MHAIAGTIHVLMIGALQAEGDVEGVFREFRSYSIGEAGWPLRAVAADRHGVELNPGKLALPRFGEEVRFMAAFDQRLQ